MRFKVHAEFELEAVETPVNEALRGVVPETLAKAVVRAANHFSSRVLAQARQDGSVLKARFWMVDLDGQPLEMSLDKAGRAPLAPLDR